VNTNGRFTFAMGYSQFLRFGLLALRSRFISQPLPFDANQGAVGARNVVNAKANTIGVSEIELCEIAVQVLLATVLIDALQAALKDAVVTLNGISVNLVAIPVSVAVFAAMMVNSAMLGKFIAKFGIAIGFVGHHFAFAGDIGSDNWDNFVFGSALNMERANRAAALNQTKDGVFMPRALLDLEAVFATDVGLINLDGRAIAAHRGKRTIAHSLPDAMAQMPSGFQPNAQHALKLAGADPLLARAKQVDGLQPHSQRQVTILEDGSNLDGELLTAGIALVKSYASGFAREFADVLFGRAAMRANRASRPKARFNIGVSGLFVVEMIFGKNGRHGISPYGETLHYVDGCVK
jgi:hypothetical protein